MVEAEFTALTELPAATLIRPCACQILDGDRFENPAGRVQCAGGGNDCSLLLGWVRHCWGSTGEEGGGKRWEIWRNVGSLRRGRGYDREWLLSRNLQRLSRSRE